MQHYFRLLILSILWAIGSLMASSVSASADNVLVLYDQEGHVALIGNASDINRTVQPFVAQQELRLLRNYPSPAAYLAEGGRPAASALRLYEVMTFTVAAQEIISDMISKGQDNGVGVQMDNLDWLTYLPDEMLVSGPCNQIPDAINRMNEVGGDLNLAEIGTVAFDYRGLPADPAETICISAFRFAPQQRVQEVVDRFNQSNTHVLAEPNYLASGAQYIAGSPGGPMKPARTMLTLQSPLTTTGKGVAIYAFDGITPYTLTLSFSRTVAVSGSQEITLHAFAPLPPTLPNRPAAPAHGIFVVSPIVQLAPAAEIHLVRTLNSANYGDAWTLIQSLDGVLLQLLDGALHQLPPDKAVVFNYSFVLAGPNQPTSNNALTQMLDVVNQLGIVQVGAVGNDSAYTSQPLSATLPASHAAVIAVEAMTEAGQRACYSNIGEISALGGGLARGSALPCHTTQMVVNCNATNAKCVSGWTPRPSGTNFSWGLGTSFAAPIITAVAAQVIEQEMALGNPIKPDDVWAKLEEMAAAGCDENLRIGCRS